MQRCMTGHSGDIDSMFLSSIEDEKNDNDTDGMHA